MAASKASRLTPEEELIPVSSLVAPLARPSGRFDRSVEPEVSGAHGSARELSSQPDGLSGAADGAPSDLSVDALDRAADSIRPSWHSPEPALPARLPPPAPLPVFEPYALPGTPLYTADSTQRTSALLPERAAALLRQPQVRRAAHFMRVRPWATALGALGGALLLALLIALFSGAETTKPATGVRTAKASVPERAEAPSPNPPTPALPPAATLPSAPVAAENALEPAAAEATAPSPAASRVKKRDKRVARTAKGTLAKPSAAKKNVPGAR